MKRFRPGLVADAGVRHRLTAGALAAGVVHGAHVAHAVAADTESGRTAPWVASTLVLGPSLIRQLQHNLVDGGYCAQ